MKVVHATYLVVLLCVKTYSQPITLEEIWGTNHFSTEYFDDVRFLQDGKTFARLVSGNIVAYDAIELDSLGTIFKQSAFEETRNVHISSFTMDSTNNSFLLETDTRNKYRHSSQARYFLFNKKVNSLSLVNTDDRLIEAATLSPDGKRVAFVRDNNLFVKTGDNVRQITHDGALNAIINALPDWIHEEEFDLEQAYQWSPDGAWLAWIRFDESMVHPMTIPIYDSIYPSLFTYKYPKVGTPIAKPSVSLLNVKTMKTKRLPLPDSIDYIPQLSWSHNGQKLAIEAINRPQNKLTIHSFDVLSGKSTRLYNETSPTFIQLPNYFTWMKDNATFSLVTMCDGARRLCYFDSKGALIRCLTPGDISVLKTCGYDKYLDYIYFEMTDPDELNSKIFRVQPGGESFGFITPETGRSTNVIFSRDFMNFIYTNTNAQQEFTVYAVDYEKGLKNVLYSNTQAVSTFSSRGFARKEFFKINDGKGGYLNAYAIKPVDFDESRKCSILLYLYGGPGVQTVANEFDFDYYWQAYLARKDIITISVDPRGTPGRDQQFSEATFKKLGIVQMEDVETTVAFLKSQNWVDTSKIGIEGWSFGGYMALMALTHSKSFACGVAIAPPTDWTLYDAAYTERYMQLPEQNKEGYPGSSPLASAHKLHGDLLLIHGSADDNVHAQNSFLFCKKLQESQIPVETLFFTDKSHSISGRQSRLYLYSRMCSFIEKGLGKR